MASLYVRSTDGSDADNGTTWALAKATLAGALAIDSPGDTIYLSQAHSETTATTVTILLNAAATTPAKLICCDDGAEPPTTLAKTTVIATTGVSLINVDCDYGAYIYGVKFKAGSSTSNSTLVIGNSSNQRSLVFDNCHLETVGTGASSLISVGLSAATTGGGIVTFDSCTFTVNSTGSRIQFSGRSVEINGGSYIAGSAAPTGLFNVGAANTGASVVISGFDFSALAAASNIVQGWSGSSKIVLRNCKLPASWTGSLIGGTITPGIRAEMHNCDNSDTNYRLWIQDYTGSVKQDTAVTRTGGANDGTAGGSWKMASSANAIYPVQVLYSPEIAIWNESVGSSVTLTVEIVTDNVTLKENECWLEVQYLGTTDFPLSVFESDGEANVLTGLSNTSESQTPSSETWTTTGLTTPVMQKLSVTVISQEKGYIHATVGLAKPSTTVYVCPKAVIS